MIINESNTPQAQRNRITQWLADNPRLTTEQARHELDVMHPAGRIKELREEGFDIITYWDNYPTSNGKTHRMASYVLMGAGSR